MTNQQRIELWDAINAYTTACNGDPSKHVYGNLVRMNAVAKVEAIIRTVERAIAEEATKAGGRRG